MNDTTSQYLYRIELLRPALLVEGPTPEEAAVLEAHLAYLQQLAQDATVLLAGRTQSASAPFGIVIINDTTEEAARRIMSNDPAVKHGLMKAEIHPYKIAVLSADIVNTAPQSA